MPVYDALQPLADLPAHVADLLDPILPFFSLLPPIAFMLVLIRVVDCFQW